MTKGLSILLILIGIGLATYSVLSFYYITGDYQAEGARISQEINYTSLEYLQIYATSIGAIVASIVGWKNLGLKKRELDLKERELNHKYGGSENQN